MASETDGGIQTVEAARNQALWREVNERIRLLTESLGSMEFVCECADMDCTETVHLSVAEYDRIRSSPTRFPIAVGHDYPEFEDVVEVCDRYAVVEKHGEAAEVSAKLDQRSQKLPLSLTAPRRGMAGPESSRTRPGAKAAVDALRRR